jgi:hypothetical protein
VRVGLPEEAGVAPDRAGVNGFFIAVAPRPGVVPWLNVAVCVCVCVCV